MATAESIWTWAHPLDDDRARPRQRAWLTGRLTYLALASTASRIAVRVSGVDADGARWSASGVVALVAEGGDGADEITIELPPEDPVNPGAGERAGLRSRLIERAPLLADGARQSLLSLRHVGARMRHRVLAAPPVGDDVPAVAAPDAAPAAAPSAALVGMYWLGLGGAERWALRCAALVAEAGLLPVVLVDHPEHLEYLLHPDLDGALVLVGDLDDDEAARRVLRRLAVLVDLRGVSIHHSHLVYRLLPELTALRPGLAVVDSTHIVEWEDGGFPFVSARHAALVQQHHVISPPLADELVRLGVDRATIVVAPLLRLGGLGAAAAAPPAGRGERRDPLVLGFVGRLVAQKRPFLFLEIVRRLRAAAVPIRAIVHGDGPGLFRMRRLVSRWGMEDVVEFRSGRVPVRETYDEIDVLVITSQAEGLTLTAMEATAHGIPVLSADVGAQRALVPSGSLLPRFPRALVRTAVRRLRSLRVDPGHALRTVAASRALADRLRALPDAEEWAARTFREWAAGDPSIPPTRAR